MNDKQNDQTSSAGQKAQGLPDTQTELKENIAAVDSRAKDMGEGDRTDAPDMHSLDNDEEE